jgi:hypothetical protein
MKSSCHFFSNHLEMPTQFSNSNSSVTILHVTNLYSNILPDSPRYVVPLMFSSRFLATDL